MRDITYTGSSIRDWPDDRLLRLLNREIEEYLVPLIATARKNHFVTFKDIPLVANQRLYTIPSRAAALKTRAVQLVDASGNPFCDLQERELEDGINLGASGVIAQFPAGTPQVYWFVGNQLSLFPVPSGSPALSLRVYYLNRPSQLVAASSCIQITAFPGGAAAGNFRVSFSGTLPAGYVNGTSVDCVQNVPGFDVLLTGPVAAQTTTTLDITGTQPSNLAVGDWICVTGTAPVITGSIPEMVIGCLVRICQLEVISGKADDAAFGRASKMLALAEKRAAQFLNKRNTGDRPKAGMGSLYKFRRGVIPGF